MRLNKYISEDLKNFNLDEGVELIKKNCSQYLKESKGKWFYRSIGEYLNDNSIAYKKIRTDRVPRGMNTASYKWLNSWLRKNNHVERDKSISASSDKEQIFIMFGIPSIIFPENGYKYTWIKAHDINIAENKGWDDGYIEDMDLIEKGDIRSLFSFRNTPSKDEIDKFKKEFASFFTSNKNMNIAYKNKYEIWFSGKGYYAIPSSKIDHDSVKKLKI